MQGYSKRSSKEMRNMGGDSYTECWEWSRYLKSSSSQGLKEDISCEFILHIIRQHIQMDCHGETIACMSKLTIGHRHSTR